MFSGMLHCVPTLHRHNIAKYSPFFSSCAVVSVFGSGGKQVLVYILMYLEYHTVVVLCQFFWFWREIVFGVTYVLSVQYSCVVVFLKNDYLVSLF